MLLVQDGKLDLDDDIRRVVPEMPDYGTPITIRHLLNHTSGLRQQWSLMALTGNGPGAQAHTNAMILDLASRQKGLNFTPGAEFLYTNTNYVLAAIIVERVSGTSLQAFTDQRLFQPLGMVHTHWREDFRTVVPGRASAYSPTDDGFVANMPFTSVYGNGGLLSTVGDLLLWNAFLDAPSVLPGGRPWPRPCRPPAGWVPASRSNTAWVWRSARITAADWFPTAARPPATRPGWPAIPTRRSPSH